MVFQSYCQTLKLRLRIPGLNHCLDNIQQSIHPELFDQAANGKRWLFVFQAGGLFLMQEQHVVTQHAQDHATLRPFVALLQGSVAPAFMKFPVLEEHLDQPPQSVKPGNVIVTPGEIGSGKVAILIFPFIFQSYDETLLAVRFDFQPCT